MLCDRWNFNKPRQAGILGSKKKLPKGCKSILESRMAMFVYSRNKNQPNNVMKSMPANISRVPNPL